MTSSSSSIKWCVGLAAAMCFAGITMPGCELLVDFDRSKIPVEGGIDASIPDASATTDQAAPETGDEAIEAGDETDEDASMVGEAGPSEAGAEATTGSEPVPEAAPPADAADDVASE